MSERECDRLWEVDALREQRLGPKDADAAERHMGACDVCGAARLRAEELDEWLGGASPREPSALALRRLRVRMLRSVGAGDDVKFWTYRMHAALASALGVIVVIVGVALVRRHHAATPIAVATIPTAATSSTARQSEPTFLAAVHPANGARWMQTRNASIEHVELDEGTLSIHVRHRTEQEQLIVDLPDGAIEDRGTTFEVSVLGGHTTRVLVSEGVVALHIRGANEVLLHAGDSWPPPQASAPPRALAVSTANVSTSRAASIPQTHDDGSVAYAAAVALFRQRSYAEAATAFDRYLQAYPHEPDAEDASYLEAVALAQSGNANGAMRAAEQHLSTYPTSFHRKEASLLIARLARDAGDCAKARRVLDPWLGGKADAEAVATLRSCAGP